MLPPLPSPEIIPALDETPPVIGPNLASNETLCQKVTAYIAREFAVPYIQMQQRLHPVWKRADEAWRARMDVSDLDVLDDKRIQDGIAGRSGAATRDLKDGKAKSTPAAIHKQMDAILNMGVALSWEDGLPVKAKKPKTVFEHPLYNPEQQGVEAANEVLEQNAREIDLKTVYRKNLGSFIRYGHAWALPDFCKELEDVKECYPLSDFPQIAIQQALQLRQKYGRQEDTIEERGGRMCLIFTRRVPKTMHTRFQHLDVDAVFVDHLLPLDPVDRQPCPLVRSHITAWELRANAYDAEKNPFGWVNIEKAMEANGHHYSLNDLDANALRTRMAEKWGLSEANLVKPDKTIKQLWTGYAMLGIDEQTGELDEGEGIDCRDCQATGRVKMELEDGSTQESDCPMCAGTRKVHPPQQRYVVQFFGSLYYGGQATCIRIQRNPTAKDKVPLLFAAHMVEDTAGAIPTSKVEIARTAFEQLTTAHNQFRESKDKTINRPWKKRIDGPAWNVDCNAPGATIPWEGNPNEAERVQGNTYDETQTLLPYMQTQEAEVKLIFGATDQVLGMISNGRRAAAEIVSANEAAKLPLTVQIDGYNKQMMGGWAQMALDNLEVYGDRDWMRKRTGRTIWGKLDLFTQTADEYVKKLQVAQNARYILESTANDPSMMQIRPKLWGMVFKGMGIDIDPSELDGGMRKAQMQAMKIVAEILGDGKLTPPDPSDPHDIYLAVFNEAFRSATTDEDDYWHERGAANLQLLAQRIQMQMTFQLQQQMMEMRQQMSMMPPPTPAEQGNEPAAPPKPARHGGELMQQQQG